MPSRSICPCRCGRSAAGHPDTVAIFYGPILLAGDLGVDGLDEAKRYGPSAPPLSSAAMEVPALVADVASALLRPSSRWPTAR